MSELKVVGHPVTRVDVDDKVTGAAAYGYDLVLPDMLHGKVLFSTRPHARIVSIDLEKARRHPGVAAAISGADVPWTHGESIKDKPFLAQGKVRYIGEPVAAVAAVDEDTAQAALKLIEVEYEDLPAYFTPEEACRPGAVAIHEEFEGYRKAPFIVGAPMPNVCQHFKLRTGDTAEGFRQSDLVLEESYYVPVIQHAAMEPHSAHAQVDPETGRVTVWVANDAPFRALTEVAEALGLPQEKIRFINPLQGGGFGSKGGLKLEPIAMGLAFHTGGRPVRVKFNREETFISTLVRHEATVTVKSGVKNDGTLMARHMTLYWGGGAYSEKSPTVCIRGSLPSPGPYRIPHVHVDGYAVYTNKPVAGAFRGYGIPQGAWATEQHMDELARRLAMDPLEFRLKNVFVDGDTAYWGEQLHSVGLTETLTRAAAAIDWDKPRPGRGRTRIGLHLQAHAVAHHLQGRRAAGYERAGHGAGRNGGDRPGMQHHPFTGRRGRAAHPHRAGPGGAAGHRRHPVRRVHHVQPQHLSHGQRRARGRHRRARAAPGDGRPDARREAGRAGPFRRQGTPQGP